VHTDSGIVGIGETYRELDEAAVRRNVAAVAGKNVLDLNLAMLELPDRGSYAASRWLSTISSAKPSTGLSTGCSGPAPSMASFLSNSYLAAAAGMPVWHGSGHELVPLHLGSARNGQKS